MSVLAEGRHPSSGEGEVPVATLNAVSADRGVAARVQAEGGAAEGTHERAGCARGSAAV